MAPHPSPSPVLCRAEELHPGVGIAAVRRGRQIHGLRETGQQQLKQLCPERREEAKTWSYSGAEEAQSLTTTPHKKGSVPSRSPPYRELSPLHFINNSAVTKLSRIAAL